MEVAKACDVPFYRVAILMITPATTKTQRLEVAVWLQSDTARQRVLQRKPRRIFDRRGTGGMGQVPTGRPPFLVLRPGHFAESEKLWYVQEHDRPPDLCLPRRDGEECRLGGRVGV